MVIVLLVVTAHALVVSLIVRETVIIPALAYIMPEGYCNVLVAGVAPAPKFHNQVTPFEVPVFTKSTGKPVHLGALDVNEATGVVKILMVSVDV